jgi:hypothetical protein
LSSLFDPELVALVAALRAGAENARQKKPSAAKTTEAFA